MRMPGKLRLCAKMSEWDMQGLGDFQGRLIIVLSKHTPTEDQCLGTVQAQKAFASHVSMVISVRRWITPASSKSTSLLRAMHAAMRTRAFASQNGG